MNFVRTRPSKQCEFCNYLYDRSLISQGCQSGSNGQRGPSDCHSIEMTDISRGTHHWDFFHNSILEKQRKEFGKRSRVILKYAKCVPTGKVPLDAAGWESMN